MTPFSHKDYNKNADLCGDHLPCAVCGKPVKSADAPMVRVLDGGARFATKAEAEREDADDPAADMGFFPVGPDCARKLSKAGVHMVCPA